MILGALEGGGTKMVCAVGDEFGHIADRVTIPTGTPEVTLRSIADYFSRFKIEALGIAFFGPLDLNRSSKRYGYVTSSTKLGWQNCDVLGFLRRELGVPCGFDTDVNGSCLGEMTFGSMRGLLNGAYITIGTGVGVGMCCDGKLVHGMLHPEAGHLPVRRSAGDDFSGICPFHGDCLEGMASGPAILKRAGIPASEIPEESQIWQHESFYIAQGIVSLILTLSPERVVLGGGVMHRTHLFPMIREDVKRLLNGYIVTDRLVDIDSYIVPSSLGDDQGILGALCLARAALE